ncbi:Signal peptidase I [hydrothermal vent metagenome]|uniref:signal peptidase I n=1 Tax=hydrothermal vent metagenome TaxID=652676 RepID=A0A3B0R4U0_9ZZZZ
MASKAEKADAKSEDGVWETIKVVIQALLIAFFVRLFLFQPFNIPSESMVPTLRVGDYLFVNKLSYGYGPYSFNFSAGFRDYELFAVNKVPFSGRVLEFGKPKRGEVVVFKLPSDTKVDYIKRLIGLPGDKIQVREGVLYLNDKAVKREKIEDFIDTEKNGQRIEQFRETLPNGVSYITHNLWDSSGPGADNTAAFIVPPGNYFMIGDNRDNSLDSRFANGVGFVPYENMVGRATILFFSHTDEASFWKFWNWPWVIRWSRIFSQVQG